MRSMLLLSAGLALLAACNQNLPVYSNVEDLRILAVRAEPPAYLFDRTDAALTFDALVVDPLGGPVDFSWSFCPVESLRACADFDDLNAQVAPAFQPTLTAAHALGLTGTAVPADASPDLPSADTLRPYAIATFTLPADQLALLAPYYLSDQFFGFGMGIWPSAVLTLTRPGDSVTGYKRFVASVADLSAYNDLVQSTFGYFFCPPGQTENCIPWQPDLAVNHNPVFAGLQWSEGKTPLATWQDLPTDGPLHVKVAASVRILPSFTPESAEPYQVLQTNLETQVVEVQPAVEDISVAWFSTAGKLQDPLTWPKFTKTLDTVYTAPDTQPQATNGLVTLWLVARDQRGGESWAHVDVMVDP